MDRPEDICLSCGLCCNGVIFGDVKLLPQDPVAQLHALGVPLLKAPRRSASAEPSWRFVQPCAQFDGCKCRIYESRPTHCLKFECLVLNALQNGSATVAEALRVIRRARRQAARVNQLLIDLGDADQTVALGKRFRRTAKQLENRELDAHAAELFGELTVAFHELNLLLQARFYPAASP